MPYSRSQARIDASERLRTLKEPYHYARIRTRALPTFLRDAVYQNCVFQLSALLEDYLQSVSRSWFDNLQSMGANNSALPEYTRTMILLKYQEEAFKRFIGLGDESSFSTKILEEKSVFSVLDSSKAIPDCDLNDLIISDKKFPSIRNFDKLFKRLGIEKIYGKISMRTKSTFDLNLQSFMDMRNALAHECPPSITHVDVGRYFQQIELWIGAIDRIFYSHVVKTSGSPAWL